MRDWFRALDRVLRGHATKPDSIRDAQIDIPVFGLCCVLVLMAMFYGLCMGSFALFRESSESLASSVKSSDRYLQMLASSLKVPALFCLTLLVTFPSLYVFNALVGSRLNLPALFRLLIAALCVNLAVLASFGTIVAFFSVSTTSYHFMLLFNVAVFALSGMLGLAFLTQTLNRMSQATVDMVDVEVIEVPTTEQGGESESESDNPSADTDSDDEPTTTASQLQPRVKTELGALDKVQGHVLGPHVRTVIKIWMVVFALVGAQMGWVLRPFIGDPNLPFQWFRNRESNFFLGVWDTIVSLLGGG